MIAICSMIKKPLNFKTWIDYHLSIGIKHFFLRIEESPELSETLDLYSDFITVEYHSNVDVKHNYWTIIDRQKVFINNTIEKCRHKGISWLLHIDCDELLWCKEKPEIFLSNIPQSFTNVSIKNVEAVYPEDSLENPFLETGHFISSGLAYINGKSIGRISEGLTCPGPHGYSGETFEVERQTALILHFESSTFESWYNKFLDRANTSDEFLQTIPFSFYRESIKMVRKGNIDKCREYYNKMKVEPYYGEKVIKLFWTPLLQEKNSIWSR